MSLFFTEGMRQPIDVDGTDEPVSWGVPAYVPMPLEQLRELPKVGRRSNVPGVYFLWHGKKLVYVGSSQHVLSRVSTHCRYAPVRFDAATFLAVDWPWQFAVEAIYIDHYGPAGNDTHNRKPRFAAHHKLQSRNKPGRNPSDSITYVRVDYKPPVIRERMRDACFSRVLASIRRDVTYGPEGR